MKKLLAILIVGLGLPVMFSHAALVLDVNPNTDGDWVFHLTGNHDGSGGVNFYNDISQSTAWNQTQGGAGGGYVSDLIESFNISGHVNSSIIDAYDVGDGVVAGDTFFKGIATDGTYFNLKFDSSFSANTGYEIPASSVSEWTSANFDETLVLKPSDKGSFASVWNDGVYTDGAFSVHVSYEVVPEPAAMGMIGGSCTSLLIFRGLRRRKMAGQTLLPIRKEHRCDVFCSDDEWRSRNTCEYVEEDDSTGTMLVAVEEAVGSYWSSVKNKMGEFDKAYWNYMVKRNERRVARRQAFRLTFKKKALDGLDTFLASIMK